MVLERKAGHQVIWRVQAIVGDEAQGIVSLLPVWASTLMLCSGYFTANKWASTQARMHTQLVDACIFPPCKEYE